MSQKLKKLFLSGNVINGLNSDLRPVTLQSLMSDYLAPALQYLGRAVILMKLRQLSPVMLLFIPWLKVRSE